MPKGIQEASISMAQEQNTKKKKQVGYNNKKKISCVLKIFSQNKVN